MTEDQMNPDICPSALEDDGTLDRTKWGGAHKWDDTTDPITCAECGTTKDEVPKCSSCDKPATVNFATVYMKWDIVNGEYIQPGISITTLDSNDYCDDHKDDDA